MQEISEILEDCKCFESANIVVLMNGLIQILNNRDMPIVDGENPTFYLKKIKSYVSIDEGFYFELEEDIE